MARRSIWRSERADASSGEPGLLPELANFVALGLEVDHDVRDRDLEALACARDDASFEPVRPAFGMGRDDHLVGAEGAERVLDRLQRVAVADLAARLDPGFAEPPEALLEPLARLLARAVDVGGEVSDGRVQRRRDDEHLGAVALGLPADLLAQRLTADC